MLVIGRAHVIERELVIQFELRSNIKMKSKKNVLSKNLYKGENEDIEKEHSMLK